MTDDTHNNRYKIKHQSAADQVEIDIMNETGTLQIAKAIGHLLTSNDLISLEGDLGAGKTHFTKGLAEGLGIKSDVTSPTFTLLIEHEPGEAGLPLYHFDAYRLGDSQAFIEAGLDEYFQAGGVCVIEWGTLIADLLPVNTIRIILSHALSEQPDSRRMTLIWPNQPQKVKVLIQALKGGSV